MTLKEKLKKQLDTATPTLNRPYYQSEKLEKIADDFAIGFAEWFELNSIYNGSEFLIYIEDNKQYKIQQFLEIYKKEKGL
jgi:hypothetical protein